MEELKELIVSYNSSQLGEKNKEKIFSEEKIPTVTQQLNKDITLLYMGSIKI